MFVQAWNTFATYANFRLPPEPDGFYGYNALQQLAYFATIFIMAPVSILTGLAMFPALVNRFPAYTRIFGGRQGARSVHFLMLIGFIVVHVTLVALTGFARNMNHINGETQIGSALPGQPQRTRPLNSRRDGLDVRHELRVQGHVEAVRARRSSGVVEGVDDHAKGRESGPFDFAAWGLTRDVTESVTL